MTPTPDVTTADSDEPDAYRTLLLATASEIIARVLAEYTSAEDDQRRAQRAVVDVLVEVGAFPERDAVVSRLRSEVKARQAALDAVRAAVDGRWPADQDEHIHPALRNATHRAAMLRALASPAPTEATT